MLRYWSAVLLLVVAIVRTGEAQTHAEGVTVPALVEASAGSELERYLRMLQVAGIGTPYPWSVREFTPAELRRIAPSDDLWGVSKASSPRRLRRVQWWVIRPRLENVLNVTAPFSYGDGATWAGRGLTTSVEGGVVAALGPLSLTLAPRLFTAQNASFEMVDNGRGGAHRFGDAYLPDQLDRPQRFGDGRYTRGVPGQSAIRFDALGIAAGLSWADQVWGPAMESPLVLSDNAEGFPHVYVGTASPLRLGIGRVHGRVILGRLEQSPYVAEDSRYARRQAAGLVATFEPAGLSGLELGVTRFIHSPFPAGGQRLSSLRQAFETAAVNGVENQIVGVFFRLVAPRSRVEIYGEFLRNDRSANLRDLLVEPDHAIAYLLGLQRVVRRAGRPLVAMHVEVATAAPSHLGRVRPQATPYQHDPLVQGHTSRGQVMGGYLVEQGGSGGVAGLDVYATKGRLGVRWLRALHANPDPQSEGVQLDRAAVMNALTVEGTSRGSRWELFARATAILVTGKQAGTDRSNFSMATGIRCGCGAGPP